ncbi:QsdR family transcriptional regulator [Paraburkholderia sp. HP33-1]|uniref:QsdR family transcriptional regulator n=1 Tax=Paraburkholderia sp. HP33-1 TaxID=2883243 RepID=UPI001EEBEA03|nr:QsdR family transcriptional regulator [Paraburkholderia sp. HP33-1]
MASTSSLVPTVAYLSAHAEKSSPRKVRATPADAFVAARAMFDQGESFDMVELAKRLGVARATLYRWIGDRERLLADVIWSLVDDLIEQSKHVPGNGSEMLANALVGIVKGLAESGGLRALFRNDAELAMRILTRRRDTGTQERAVEALTVVIRRLEARGHYAPRLPAELLAYSIVRLIEGLVYQDMLLGLEPSLDNLARVIRALL